MVKKSIATGIILFLAYSLFVNNFAPVWWFPLSNPMDNNTIKAERYVYGHTDTLRNVIVGSSLSARIRAKDLKSTFNLALSGQSIFDGLALILGKPKFPSTIYIEMNIMPRLEDKEFTSSIVSPVMIYPRMAFRSLLKENQPIPILGRVFNERITLGVLSRITPFFQSKKAEQHELVSFGGESVTIKEESLFEKMLKLQIQDYNKIPDDKFMDLSFRTLRRKIDDLESSGVKVIFFEIPVNQVLVHSAKGILIRDTFKKYFPSATYIPLPDDYKQYVTSDGLHLTETESIKYTNYFKNKMAD